MIIEVEVMEGIQIPPKFNKNIGFQTIHECGECKYTAADIDINPYEPCPNCGSRFSSFDEKVAKWDENEKRWLKKIKNKNLFSLF
jgi:hypothetical protein